MRTPTEFDLQQLMRGYDLGQARRHYEKHRKVTPPIRHDGHEALQHEELQTRAVALSEGLIKLEALIEKREYEEARENRKAKARKERAAKDKDQPQMAAQKAQAIRQSRRNHRVSNGGFSDKKTHSVSELKSLATKVRGQIAVAKQKLAAL